MSKKDDLIRAVEDALSDRRHRLVREGPNSVACTCGRYLGPNTGDESAGSWRDHLIRAATDVIQAAKL